MRVRESGEGGRGVAERGRRELRGKVGGQADRSKRR